MTGRRTSERGGIVTRLSVVLFVLLFFLLLYLARHPLMRFAAEAWVVEDSLHNSDAILLLGDDNFYADRASRAAELFRQGLAPVVVASGRRLRPDFGLAEVMTHDLVERGVPKDRVIPFPQNADDTIDEAQALAPFAVKKKWRNVIVVTSSYHTRRARYVFRRVFPPSITILVASAHDGDFEPADWYEKRRSVKRFLLEIEAMAAAVWQLRHKRALPPGAQLVVFQPAETPQFVV